MSGAEMEVKKVESPFLRLASGRSFRITDSTAADIELRDIAHALSHLCRFAGHTPRFYSVAQHSAHVARLVGAWASRSSLQGEARLHLVRAALLHDASEAYLVDLPRPVKVLLPEYAALEERVQKLVHERFGVPELPEWVASVVKQADDTLLQLEMRTFFPATGAEPGSEAITFGEPLLPWDVIPKAVAPLDPETARYRFLSDAERLGLR